MGGTAPVTKRVFRLTWLLPGLLVLTTVTCTVLATRPSAEDRERLLLIYKEVDAAFRESVELEKEDPDGAIQDMLLLREQVTRVPRLLVFDRWRLLRRIDIELLSLRQTQIRKERQRRSQYDPDCHCGQCA